MIVAHRPPSPHCSARSLSPSKEGARLAPQERLPRPPVSLAWATRLWRPDAIGGAVMAMLLMSSLLWSAQAAGQPVPPTGVTPAPAASPAPIKPKASAIPPLRLAGAGSGQPSAGLLRVVAHRGEVVFNHAGDPPEEALGPSSVLSARDELITRAGSVELIASTGTSLQLGSQGLVALLARDALYLARGELTVSTRNDQAPQLFFVATSCGRSWVRAREARVRVEGNVTNVEVTDGWVRLGGGSPGAVDLRAGQASRCNKGEAPSPPRPLLAAPQWLSIGDLFLTGEGTRDVSLRFSPVLGAARYRLDLLRYEGGSDPVLVNSLEVAGDQGQVELRNIEVGSYHVRLFSVDDSGARGSEGRPLRFLVARVAGLSPTGMVHTQAGQMPAISGPTGLPTSILIDGEAPIAGTPRQGMHRLRVLIAGLYAEVPLNATASSGPSAEPSEPASATVQPPPVLAVSPSPTPPGSGGSPVQALPPISAVPPTAAPSAQTPSTASAADDVLLGGVGEVPLEGLRSPWARSTIGGRIEFTTHNTLRIAAGGRWLMRNGFGADVWISVLRAAMMSPPAGRSAVGFGNLNAALRTPALRRFRFALQGLVSVVAPTSTSYVDRSIAIDPAYSSDGSPLRVDALPDGTGWRTEAAALIGVHFRNFHLFTNHGASLRVAPAFSAAYVGGVVLQADVLSLVRFISFASWQVGYLGLQITPESTLPDAGGAVGGGIEVPLRITGRGILRLALIGRAGLGLVGAAQYGRGAIGLQAGYVF